MKTIQKMVGAMVALIAIACSGGTGPGPGDASFNPVAVSVPEIGTILPTRVNFTFKVTGDAVRVTGVCKTLAEDDPNGWHEELDALTSDGETYTYVAGARTPLHADTGYAFIARGYDPDGKAIEKRVEFRTKPVEVTKWDYLQKQSGLSGHYKQVPPPGKEDPNLWPEWNCETNVSLVDDPELGKVIGPFCTFSWQKFNAETLHFDNSETIDYAFVAPCDSSVLTMWTAEVKAEVDSFNQSHGNCRPGVTWRVETLVGGELTELFER